MKHFLLLFVLFAFQKDTAMDYNLLIGSWKQKAFANTANTGIFSFSKDSTATLEMIKGDTGDLIASIKGSYSINKTKNKLTMTIMGRPKTFNILVLKKEVLTIKNITENKDAQTFERLGSKE
ncbi:hypothetical protein J2X31_000253 [Flavobacterium arsenatis]|uniref:Lipocalin-like domain-containing protein n=1 Tax=Flavobacterium arsenatis TaxID=1484332 RepID=A0ABU1TK00_9FLAO|nr:hypothetical protein [Flavobacterium arsenatis]MDR6966260.1 hypothetical protein [Flavobacterium arsenatis]